MNTSEIRARIDHPIIDSDGHAIEYLPLVRDILLEQAGPGAVAGFERVIASGALVRRLTPEQMRAAALVRTSWWGLPARNTLDRATALLPALLAQRLPEIGIDHAVLYPTYGLVPPNLDDADLRRAAHEATLTRGIQPVSEAGRGSMRRGTAVPDRTSIRRSKIDWDMVRHLGSCLRQFNCEVTRARVEDPVLAENRSQLSPM